MANNLPETGSRQEQAYQAALALLTRRDHSRLELAQKLSSKFPGEPLEPILDRVVELGYQCDRRFAEIFVRSRVARLQGPVRIKQELRQRGVEQALIDQAMSQQSFNWFSIAEEALSRKFFGRAEDPKERARRQRFLAYRGFSMDVIRELV